MTRIFFDGSLVTGAHVWSACSRDATTRVVIDRRARASSLSPFLNRVGEHLHRSSFECGEPGWRLRRGSPRFCRTWSTTASRMALEELFKALCDRDEDECGLLRDTLCLLTTCTPRAPCSGCDTCRLTSSIATSFGVYDVEAILRCAGSDFGVVEGGVA